MDFKNKYVLVSGGLAVSALIGGLYYLFKIKAKVQLNEWLEEYFKEIGEMISKDKELSVNTIGHIFHLMTEVEDYFYYKDNSDLEEERQAVLNNKEEYGKLFGETVDLRNEYYDKAVKYVEKRLNVSLNHMNEILKKSTSEENRLSLKNARKAYTNLPEVSSTQVRDAYIFWAREKKVNFKHRQEQLYIAESNPEYQAKAFIRIYFMKTQLKDNIKAKYKIEEKYLEQLIEKHDLLKDSEVKYYFDELQFID